MGRRCHQAQPERHSVARRIVVVCGKQKGAGMNVVSIQKQPDDESIELLQEMIELAQRGELSDIVVVGCINDADGPGFIRSASFKDRWRLLGAIEYAKGAVK